MKKMKGSLGGKVAAQVLLFLMVITFLASALGTALLVNGGAYEGGTARIQDVEFYHYVRQDARRAVQYYENAVWGNQMSDPFARGQSNFSFRILDETAWENGTGALGIFSGGDLARGVEYGTLWVNGYYVTCFLDPNLSVNDKYSDLYEAYQALYTCKWFVVVLVPVSFVLSLALFIYLMAAAGWRKDGELRQGVSDRIPVDVHLCFAAFLIMVLLYLTFEVAYYDALIFSIAIGSIAALAAYVVAMWFVYSFARRVKHKGWWRNSVIYFLCAFCKKHGLRLLALIKRFFRWCGDKINLMIAQLPLIWKVALTVVGILFLMAIIWFSAGWRSLGFGAALLLTVLVTGGALVILTQVCHEMLLLKDAGEELESGLAMKLETDKLHGIFREHGESLGKVHAGMEVAVAAQLRSERLKTELITNVSHDLKTPLTSIINYVDLLRREKDGEKQSEYLDVLEKHSKRLKKLTEDLLEVSKVSTGNVSVSLELLDLRESVNQAIGEYSERLEEAGLHIVTQMPETQVMARVDGRHMWRVLDNLLSNACKYSMPGSRVYCALEEAEGSAVFSMKNISREPLNVKPDELMERFVRGDAARSSEGSGLGLSIAQSLTEVQKGEFRLSIDGDLFKTELRFPLAE